MRKILFISLLFCISCERKVDRAIKDNDELSKVKQKKVEVFLIKRNIFYKTIISNGKISFLKKNQLYFKSTDKLTSVNVKNGQKVNKNQLLASLENNLLKNNVDKAKIELQKANNELKEKKINYNQEIISPTTLKSLQIKSGVLEAKNNLERAQIEYEQTLLKAPFSGVIANLEKKQGDFITTSDVFCTIINPNALEVSFSVLENEFGFISKGQEIEIQSFANKDQQFKGVITEINPIVDKNGLIKIKAKVISKNTGLLDGMNVKVFINKPLKDVLVVPKEALVLRSNREVVFTIENGLAKWNYVEVAGENNDSYAIKKGLKATDTIIVSGNLNLSHDAKVNATFVTDNSTQK
ncbi:efflux RND transporter periplasmic adaptor subunit [Tenacibaculum sp. UWU-22]|uniref:efflux RND transporter periplasmic adaptor subunit n=1 Tax=Tenacibaculum sp. UWU-22 TaxID=3234187 RepID=UPI0034DB5BF3